MEAPLASLLQLLSQPEPDSTGCSGWAARGSTDSPGVERSGMPAARPTSPLLRQLQKDAG
eukprot:1907591-Amphidinium_carterae.1